MRERVRVSIISYLNTAPLVWPLLRDRPPELEFDFTVPSRCADDLAAGLVDVGIIPSIEYQRIPDLVVLAGPAIASRERVRSILLLSRKPLDQIQTVAADISSRTSVALAELVLRCRYGCRPEVRPAEPDPSAMLAACDAAVVIGDPALHYSLAPLPGVTAVDLAAEWRTWTGLPFVFAFWAARREAGTPAMARLFADARDGGLAALDTIVPLEAARRRLPEPLVRDYLTRNIWFHLDADCLAGLDRFYALAAEHKLIQRVAPLELVQPAGAAPMVAVTEKTA